MPLIDRASVRTIAIVGAGIVGASWAAYFLARGFAVRATDTRADGEAFVRDYIAKAWPTLERFGLAPGADKKRWSFHRTPAEAATGSGLRAGERVRAPGAEAAGAGRDRCGAGRPTA